MMEAIEARGVAAGEAAAERAAERLAERLREAAPGVAVERVAGGVALSARGLRRRLLSDAALRWIGGLAR